MADNIIIPATGTGATTPTVRTKDRTTSQTQVMGVDLNPLGATEQLQGGDLTNYSTAPNSNAGIAPVGIGPGFDLKTNPANLATAANSVLAVVVNGADIIVTYIGTTTTGTITFEASADDTNWVAVDTSDVTANLWVSGTNITPTANKIYQSRVGGYRQFRVRTVTTLGVTVVVKFTAHSGHVMPVAVGTEIQALGDGTANGSTSIIGTQLAGFDATNWDRLRTTQGVTAGANTDLGILAAGVGPGFQRVVASTAVTGATTVAITTKGAASSTFDCRGTYTGFQTQVQITYDGTNWQAADPRQVIIYTPTGATSIAWYSGGTYNANTLSPVIFIINTWGAQQVRLNVTQVVSGTVTVQPTASAEIAFTTNMSVDGAVPPGSATGIDSDAQTILGVNLPEVVNVATLFNGSTRDRVRGVAGDGQSTLGVQAVGVGAWNGGTGYDRLRSVDALSSPPNVTTGILAVGIGPGFDQKINPTNLATAANSVISDNVDGANTVMVFIGTTTTGTITFEVSADDAAWVAADVLDTQANAWVSATNLTPTSGKTYRVKTAGWREWRVRTVTTLGATVAVKYTMSATAYFPTDFNPIPHAIGYTIASFSNTFSTAQTSTNLVAGTTGQRIYVVSLAIGTGGTTAGRASIYWGTGTFAAGTSPTLFDGEFAPSSTVRPGMTQSFPYPPGGSSATGDNLRLTTSAAMTIYVTVAYYKA